MYLFLDVLLLEDLMIRMIAPIQYDFSRIQYATCYRNHSGHDAIENVPTSDILELIVIASLFDVSPTMITAYLLK